MAEFQLTNIEEMMNLKTTLLTTIGVIIEEEVSSVYWLHPQGSGDE